MYLRARWSSGLTDEFVDEHALVRRLVGAEALEALAQLRAGPAQVLSLQMQESGGDLDQALIEVTLGVRSRTPQPLPLLVGVPVANAIE